MLINKHLDCLHSSNCITTVLRETQLLKIHVSISAIYMFIHMHLQYFYYSAFHAMEKRSLLRSVDNDLHFFTGFISCIQLLY